MPVIDDEETLILEELSRSEMSEKEKDPEVIKQKISNKPIDYVKLNKIYEDFRKRFVPQQELSDDEAFWYHMLNPSTKSSDVLPVKIEAPKQLPKVSSVNESLKNLKLHLANFDKVVKIKSIPNARTEGLKCSTSNYRSKPTENKKNDRISQTPSRNMKNNCVVEPIRNVFQIVLWYLDSECSKHKIGNHSQLMNIVSKFLEAINTACYTQNRSLICLRYNKPPYELMQDKKSDLSFFHVFGALYYPTNDNDDLGKLDAKADIGIFVGYAPVKEAFRIYNKRTRKIIETIHVTFNELTTMAFEQFSSGPRLHSMTPVTSSLELVLNTVSQQPYIPPNIDDWDHLFQPMFNEYFNPPSIDVTLVQEAAAPRATVLADSLVSTSIDQDAPSTSIPSTQKKNILQPFLKVKPTEKHLNTVKRIFQYLKGTNNMGLWYSKDTNMSLTAYADADYAGCQDTRRSTSGSA
nr:hypothetical protein [Tanacetum cinerariifolium]